ncbi:MAG: cation diffusion facilitator family transporter [Candidatus Thorarchaeota archaeon]
MTVTAGRKEVQKAASMSILAALFLTGIKIIVGVLTNSLGILSEAAHSGLDMAAAGITFIAVRGASHGPDSDHQFGHGKIENFAALVETLILWFTSVWIIFEAVRRIQLQEWADPSILGMIVMTISIFVDYERSRMLYRTAEKHGSQALEADALHFSTDMISSAVVLIGVLFVWFGIPLADPIAAIGVAIVIFAVSFNLGRRAFDILIDRAPEGLREEIDKLCKEVPGVHECKRTRVRLSGPELFIDVIVELDDTVPLGEAHSISDQIEQKLSKLAKQVDVVVHMEPVMEPSQESDIYSYLQRLASYDNRIVSLHNIRIHDITDGIHIAADLEMESNIDLDTAHKVSENLEAELRKKNESIKTITLHLESSSTEEQIVDITKESGELIAIVKQIVDDETPACDCHNVVVSRSEHGVTISFDCRVDGSMSLEDSHDIVVLIEKRVKERVSDIESIFIHLEPL